MRFMPIHLVSEYSPYLASFAGDCVLELELVLETTLLAPLAGDSSADMKVESEDSDPGGEAGFTINHQSIK